MRLVINNFGSNAEEAIFKYDCIFQILICISIVFQAPGVKSRYLQVNLLMKKCMSYYM